MMQLSRFQNDTSVHQAHHTYSEASSLPTSPMLPRASRIGQDLVCIPMASDIIIIIITRGETSTIDSGRMTDVEHNSIGAQRAPRPCTNIIQLLHRVAGTPSPQSPRSEKTSDVAGQQEINRVIPTMTRPPSMQAQAILSERANPTRSRNR